MQRVLSRFTFHFTAKCVLVSPSIFKILIGLYVTSYRKYGERYFPTIPGPIRYSELMESFGGIMTSPVEFEFKFELDLELNLEFDLELV